MMKHKFPLIFTIILILIMGVPIVASFIASKHKTAEAGETAEETVVSDAVLSEESAGTGDAPGEAIAEETPETQSGETPDAKEPEEEPAKEPEEKELQVPLDKYLDLLEINPYVAGWLEIDGSKINDPVVYTPGSQNYFLHRDLDGTPMEKGTFFIAVNWREGFHNTLIYGHNMKDGSGFGSLAKFADSKYGLSHSVIRFDTLYKEQEYELLAAFYSQIDEEELETEEDRADRDKVVAEQSIEIKAEEGQTITEEELTVKDLALDFDFGDADIYRQEKDEDNGRFRYYYYTDLADPDDFNYYIENVKERSLYDTGVDATYGDDLLTLSTCSYHVKNGRFIVVAVRHNDQ
ncbi:MAG: class B sortase [Lachnospiraceae bacterium]|nr:class B sortase [Lachnospiraceae bacterium]